MRELPIDGHAHFGERVSRPWTWTPPAPRRRTLRGLLIDEVSLVDRPANPAARVLIAKRDEEVNVEGGSVGYEYKNGWPRAIAAAPRHATKGDNDTTKDKAFEIVNDVARAWVA